MNDSTRCIVFFRRAKTIGRLAVASAALLCVSAAFAANTTAATVAISPPAPLGSGIFPGSVLTVDVSVTDISGSTPVPVSGGTVSVCYSTATTCTDTNRLGSAQVVSLGSGQGLATIRIRLGAGSNSIAAFYSGTVNGVVSEAPSVSDAVTVKVSSRGAATSMTSINTPTGIPGAYTLSSTVTGIGGLAPTGTVNYLDTSNANFKVATSTLGVSTLSYGYAALRQGSTTSSSTTVPLVVADVNQDGYPDLILVSSAGKVVILYGDGTGAFPTSNTSVPATMVGGVVAGDFNNDGIPDLAVASSAGVQIFFGAAGGTFTAGSSYPLPGTTPTPTRIVKGDFNGDGILDLAVSDSTNNAVTVLLGSISSGGAYTLTEYTPPGVSNAPIGLVAADFNRDGYTDLAVANSGGNSITILMSSVSSSTFEMTPSTLTSAGDSTGILVAGQFEGKNIDLATASGTTVSVLPGNGAGGFGSAATYSGPTTNPVTNLSVYDLNGDGISDLYVNSWNSSGTVEAVYLGTTSSGLSALTPTATFGISSSVTGDVAVADINGDGIRDIVAVNATSAGVDVSLGEVTYTANASVASVTVPGGGSHDVIASYVGDSTYSGSSSPSVSVTATPTDTVTTIVSSPSGEAAIGQSITLTATVTLPPPPANTPPVVGAEILAGNLTFYDNSTSTPLVLGTVTPTHGVATFTAPPLTAGTHAYTAQYNGDINFNASPISNSATVYGAYPSTVTLTTSPAAPLTSISIITLTATVVPTAGPAVTSGTINFCAASPCTGAALLGSAQIVAATSSASIKVHLNTGTYNVEATFMGTQASSASESATSQLKIAPVSLITDSLSFNTPTSIPPTGTPALTTYQLASILSASTNQVPTGSVQFIDTSNPGGNFVLNSTALAPSFAANTAGLLDAAQTITVGNQPGAIGSADLNGDGYPDLVVANGTAGTISILLNNGAGSFTVSSTINVGGAPYAVAIGDFNRDGNQDIAVANAIGNSVTILLGNGNGSFLLPGSQFATGSTPTAIVTADFNNDGYLDLAVANYFDNSLSVLYGDGNGGFTAGATINLADGGSPLSIAAGDVNSDGLPDLVVPDSTGAINVYCSTLASGFPSTATSTIGAADALSVELQDLNQDGNLDLIYTNYGGGSVNILFGDGAANFATGTGPIGVGANPGTLVIGDFNGDGLEDVIVTTSTPNQLVEVPNNGGGTFGAPVGYPLSVTGTNGVASAMVGADFALNGIPAFGIVMAAQNTVDIAQVQYSLADTVSVNPVTVYGGGTHTVIATYSGDTNFAAVSPPASPQVLLQGNLIPTTTTMGVGSTPAAGSTVTLSATVSPDTFDNYVATGVADTVQFLLNGATICAAAQVNSTGVATCQTGILHPGAANASATFSGDTNFATSVGTLSEPISIAIPVLTWATPAAITYGTALSGTQLDATASVAGSFVYSPAAGQVLGVSTGQTLTATFTPTDTTDYATVQKQVSLVVKPATSVITWATPATITYGTPLSTAQLNATANIPGSFVYSPAAGTVLGASAAHTLTVTFTPTDTTDYPTITSTVSLTVTKVALTVTANSFSIGLAQPIPTLTAAISGFANGDVAFSAISGAPSLTLTPASPSVPASYPIVAGLGTLAAANYSFTFVNGTLTIAKGSVTIVLAAPATANLGGSVTLTATLSPSTAIAPTGSISFLDGTTSLGSAPIGAGNVASLPVTFTTAGNHSITAVYIGDADYTGYTTTAQTVNVVTAGYSITASPSTLKINAGQSALTTITMSSYGGYAGTVTLSCVGLPDWAGCTFAPGSLTADGSGTAVSSKMTITTLGSSSGVITAMDSGPGSRSSVVLAEIWLPLGFVSLLLMGVSGRKRAGARKLMLMLLLAGALMSVTGCGAANCCGVPEATPGTYQVTVSAAASSGAGQTAAFTLQVLP